MRRAALALAFALALAAAAPPMASADVPIWNVAGDCVNRDATVTAVPAAAGDPVQFYAAAGEGEDAARYRDDYRDRAVWSTYRAHMGHGGLLPGQPGPFPIYVTAPGGLPAYGETTTYCTPPTETVIAIAGGVYSASNVLAHESFHAVTWADIGRPVPNNWWFEATADWATSQLDLLDFDAISRDDEAFLQHPELPLETFPGQHSYGAYRFVEWLDRETAALPGATWAFLRGSFARMSAGADATSAVAAELTAHGLRLDRELESFWADHTRFTPRDGPRTRPHELVVGAGLQSWELTSQPRAAAVVRLRLAPGIQRVVVAVDGAPALTANWAYDEENDLEDWSAGWKETYCVGLGADPEAGRHWPGEVWFAFTNGGAPSTQTLRVLATGSTSPCKRIPTPPIRLVAPPRVCPPPPPGFPPPAFHTRYYVWEHRFTRVAIDLANWTAWLNHHYRNRVKRLRAAARLLSCTAHRARAIAAPDAKIHTSVAVYAAGLRAAAAAANHGDASAVQSDLTAAHLEAGRAHYRAAVQDQNPKNA